jgi:16S rRNA (cytosine1402-N4)-methyltransferase
VKLKWGKESKVSADLAHIPVALDQCVDLLAPAFANKPKPVLLDATLGLGGHAKVFLQKFPKLQLIGIDRDQSAIKIAQSNLAPFLDRVKITHATYDQIQSVLVHAGISKVDGILFDLGVSSMQLDQAERGFSYSQPAPLDMRMDQSNPITALQILNNYSHGQLAKILQNYGEEKFASKIAENIIKARTAGTLNTTADLSQIVKDSIPAPARRSGGNPAKRTFQALRIEVNQELAILERAIPVALAVLALGARMVVMSYQSLEDRIVKSAFAKVSKSNTPPALPVELPNSTPSFQLLLSGSSTANASEQLSNPRSQSLRLRAIERGHV